jgi:argininosuccinate lyase
MRLWGGRFDDEAAETDEPVAAFGRSIDVDRELAVDDLDGSIAHVRGLGRAGILTDDEVTTLVAGLADLRRDVETGELRWDPALEDVHLNLEAALTDRLGAVAG